MSKVYVVDKREYPFYQVDNALIEKYGQYIGPYAIAVYNCLACHANREMITFPSYQTIARETGMSRASAMRAIKTLIKCRIVGLVEDERFREGTKEYENNRYHLIDQSAWTLEVFLTETGGISQQPRLPEQPGSASQQPQVVSDSDRGGISQQHKQEPENKTQINKTQQQQPVAAPPVVVVAQASSNDALPSAQTELLTQRLQAEKVSPKSVAAKLALEHPHECAAWLDYVATNPKLGAGFLFQKIKSGEMPGSANNGAAPESKPVYVPTEAERALEIARLSEAAQIAFDALSIADRAYIEKQVEMQKREMSAVMWDLKNSQVSRALKSLASAKTRA